MIAVRVTDDLHYRVVASPDYVTRHGRPQTPADLHAHNCIRYRLPSGEFIPWLFVADGKLIEFEVSGSLVVINDPELVFNAALQGIGVAYLYEEYVARMIADGRLLSLLDKSVLPVTDGFFLFYPSRRQNSAALRAFIEFLRSDSKIQRNTATQVLEHGPEKRVPSLIRSGNQSSEVKIILGLSKHARATPWTPLDGCKASASTGMLRHFVETKSPETVLPHLTAEDLKDIGVGPIGHRRKLLDAIAVLLLLLDMPPPQPPVRQ